MSVTEVTEVTEGAGQDQHGDAEVRRTRNSLVGTFPVHLQNRWVVRPSTSRARAARLFQEDHSPLNDAAIWRRDRPAWRLVTRTAASRAAPSLATLATALSPGNYRGRSAQNKKPPCLRVSVLISFRVLRPLRRLLALPTTNTLPPRAVSPFAKLSGNGRELVDHGQLDNAR